MQCPTCKVEFASQMTSKNIGLNGRGKQVYVYFQMCPSAKCMEPVVGYREKRENEWIPLDSDTEGLILLAKV
jgi:hypothetical protein